MSTVYLLCNPLLADDFNRSLMRLLMPTHLRGPDYTDFYAPKHIHPQTGYAALGIPEGHQVNVHPEATGAELDYLLGIFVADGGLTQEEAGGIRQTVADSIGKTVSILDFIPPSWGAYVLTQEQMDLDGWFPAVEEEV